MSISMREPIFRIKHVSKFFGEHVVLDDVSLDVTSGEIIGIIGASGAGKTTFLNTLIGFLRPEKGDVEFRLDHLLNFKETMIYRSVYKKQHLVKKIYGFASQIPSFYENLTTRENLEYFGSLYNLSKDAIKSNVDTLLALMELKSAQNILAGNLSGGMERRLDIACSLMHDPEVLILDEPTADLDPLLRNHIWELVRKINKKGTTIILSSHHLTELEHLCDRIAIIKDGKLLAVGQPTELKEKFVKEQDIIIETSPGDYMKILKGLKSKHIISHKIVDKNLFIRTDAPEKTIGQIIENIQKYNEDLIHIKISESSLDDMFVKIWEDKEKIELEQDDIK